MRNIDEQNFHLLYLDHLLSDRRVTEEALEEFVRAEVDVDALIKMAGEDEEEEAAARAVVARLSEYPVRDEDLADLRVLATDGGDNIYMFIEGLIDIDTGGEEDWYCTKGSPDIRRCVNVESVRANVYFQGVDCASLVELQKLTEVHLGARWDNAEALLRLPALAKVTAARPLPAGLVAELRGRGVEVISP